MQGRVLIFTDYGPGYRVYFGRVGEDVVLLLAGGEKSTQREDIAAAQGMWAEYKSRTGDESEG